MFNEKLTEQIFVKNSSGERDVLDNYGDAINLKKYFLKIKARFDGGQPLGTIPQYWIPKSIFDKTSILTFSNVSYKMNIRTYLELLNANNNIKPLYISKKVLVDKNRKSFWEGKPNVAGKNGLNSKLKTKNDIVSLRQIVYNIASQI